MPTWFTPTQEIALRLTHAFSQTATPSETAFAPELAAWLAEWPYFRQHPQALRLERTLADPIERYVLFAWVKGKGPQTLILTGHYDVVGIENYGDLADLACDPYKLLPRLLEELAASGTRREGLSTADQLALADLNSGQFLPGRGMLDMKSGLAAGLAVLQRFSELSPGERGGSLLFVAVPDEEVSSMGMRTAAQLLPEIAGEWGLDLVGAINLDASDDPGDGSRGQAIYLGSIGKLLPAVYLVGRETHASSPFSGVNAALAAAELVRRVECEVSQIEGLEGEFTSPPVCLKLADTRSSYDVTTPPGAWCYFNWLTLHRTAGEVLEKIGGLAGEALEAACARMSQAADEYSARTGQPMARTSWQPHVYPYAEVRAAALERGGPASSLELDTLQSRLAADPALDIPACSLRVVEAAWKASGLSGPAAVTGFGALYYPPVLMDESLPGGERFRAVALRQAQAVSRELGSSIAVRPFFPGISDISFLAGRVSPEEVRLLTANSPAWIRSGFDYSATARLRLPAANIGPWGRDYHQRIERVYTPYAFEILPEILWRVQRDLLTGEN